MGGCCVAASDVLLLESQSAQHVQKHIAAGFNRFFRQTVTALHGSNYASGKGSGVQFSVLGRPRCSQKPQARLKRRHRV